MIILIFGQPASGKTTLSNEIIKYFSKKDSSNKLISIDGDRWRYVTNNKDYSKEGRITNLKSAFDMAKYLDNDGFTPILSFVTPYEDLRRYLCDSNIVKMVYLNYNQDRGKDMFFAKDFEETDMVCLKLNTSNLSINDCVFHIINYCFVNKTL